MATQKASLLYGPLHSLHAACQTFQLEALSGLSQSNLDLTLEYDIDRFYHLNATSIMSLNTTSPTITKRGLNKRTSNSYNIDEWKRHRPLITQLYFEEGRTLKEVREHLEKEFNFAPTYVADPPSYLIIAN